MITHRREKISDVNVERAVVIGKEIYPENYKLLAAGVRCANQDFSLKKIL